MVAHRGQGVDALVSPAVPAPACLVGVADVGRQDAPSCSNAPLQNLLYGPIIAAVALELQACGGSRTAVPQALQLFWGTHALRMPQNALQIMLWRI